MHFQPAHFQFDLQKGVFYRGQFVIWPLVLIIVNIYCIYKVVGQAIKRVAIYCFLNLFPFQVKYSGGACSDTNIGYFIGFGTVFFFVCAVSVAQLVCYIFKLTLNYAFTGAIYV